MNTSGNEKVFHTGTCSDCGRDVDTRLNGVCYHSDRLMNIPPRMSVFLVCSPCVDTRELKDKKSGFDGKGWMPGPKHQPLGIMPRP